MDALATAGTVAIPVLAAWSVLRLWLRPGATLGDAVSAYGWSALGLAVGRFSGPGWLVPACWTTTGLALAYHLGRLLLWIVAKPIVPIDPVVLRQRLLDACRAETGPEAFLVGVSPDGYLTFWGLETAGIPRCRLRPGPGCATCLLEELVGELAVDAADVVAEYRARLAERANQLFALRRGVIDNRWKAELRPVKGARTPFEHSPCTVHRF